MKLRLVRVTEYDGATLGVLMIDGKPRWKTLELPWLNNQDNISCVPPGVYECEKYASPKHKMTVLQLKNVPDRDHAQIHIANYARELLGCIAVGLTWGTEYGEPVVYQSIKAFTQLMDAVRNTQDIKLKIVSAIN